VTVGERAGQGGAGERVALAVLMERRLARSGPWSAAQWELVGVLPGGSGAGRTCVHRDRGCSRWLWTGLTLELHRDGCEGYRFNLASGRPRLFVVCFSDEEAEAEGDEIEPLLVSASQDEATAHLESEDEVYSLPMPEAVRARVERFVARHYRPEDNKKRRRRDWKEEGRREPRCERAR